MFLVVVCSPVAFILILPVFFIDSGKIDADSMVVPHCESAAVNVLDLFFSFLCFDFPLSCLCNIAPENFFALVLMHACRMLCFWYPLVVVAVVSQLPLWRLVWLCFFVDAVRLDMCALGLYGTLWLWFRLRVLDWTFDFVVRLWIFGRLDCPYGFRVGWMDFWIVSCVSIWFKLFFICKLPSW